MLYFLFKGLCVCEHFFIFINPLFKHRMFYIIFNFIFKRGLYYLLCKINFTIYAMIKYLFKSSINHIIYLFHRISIFTHYISFLFF